MRQLVQHVQLIAAVVVSPEYKCLAGMAVILFVMCSCKRTYDKSSPQYAEFEKRVESAATNEAVMESGVAFETLKRLHGQSALPGDSMDMHGTITVEMPNFIVSNKVIEMTYPSFRTFHLVHMGETATNNYTLEKRSKDSEWKLQKAWQVDEKGKILQKWPVQ